MGCYVLGQDHPDEAALAAMLNQQDALVQGAAATDWR